MPLTITKQTVLERFPELDAEPALTNLVWAALISDANAEIPITSWLDQAAADRAGTWLIAHMTAIHKKRVQDGLAGVNQPGQLQSVTVGPVTKTYAAPASTTSAKAEGEMSDEALRRTEYGREYLRLRSRFCRARH